VHSFEEYITTPEQLDEKLLLINQGKRYGQVVFLAGGAGSGKGFASSNFMNIHDYKVRDVDEVKRLFLKIAKEKNKYPELKGLNLKNPKDVSKLHDFIVKMDWKNKTMGNMIQQMSNPETLPNILFDITLKRPSYANKVLPQLIEQGYKPENIHLVWVLTDYKIAVQQNRERERVVLDDILLNTHEGAAKSMWDIIGKGNLPKGLNGGIYVILNNKQNTIFFKKDDTKDYRKSKDDDSTEVRKGSGSGKTIIKDFKYLVYKKPGKKAETSARIKLQLWQWITTNIPMTKDTSTIWWS